MLWVSMLLATAGSALVLGTFHLPAATLFAGLLVGLAFALARRPADAALALPLRARTASQACVGVVIGATVQPGTLQRLGSEWLLVLTTILATLVLSLFAGALLARRRDVDLVTGCFAMLAGGASGLTSTSEQLGADQRVVATVQYLRVLMIVLTMPAVASTLATGRAEAVDVLSAAPGSGWPVDLLFTAVCMVVGVPFARLVRLPTAALLGPMLLAAGLAASSASRGAAVPEALEQVAYAGIGLQVGLSFTRDSLRSVRAVLPRALVLIVGMILLIAACGIPLLRLAGASVLDAYLATTPGGLYAVLATAVDTGADTTLVLTVQVLRLLLMLLLAPLLAAVLSGRGRPSE